MTPADMKLMGGLAFAAMCAATGFPAVQQKLSSVKSFLWSWLTSKSKEVEVDEHRISAVSSPVDVHMTVTQLMRYFSQQQDQEGLKLASDLGRHMYDVSVKQMGMPITADAAVNRKPTT